LFRVDLLDKWHKGRRQAMASGAKHPPIVEPVTVDTPI